jgi:hypothetical protein
MKMMRNISGSVIHSGIHLWFFGSNCNICVGSSSSKVVAAASVYVDDIVFVSL